MLSCGLHGDWLPVRGPQGVAPLFLAMDTITFFYPKLPGRLKPNLLWGMRLMKSCQIRLSIRTRPCKAAGGQWVLKFGIVLKILPITRYKAECGESNMGLPEFVQMLTFAGHGDCPGWGGSRVSLFFRKNDLLSKFSPIGIVHGMRHQGNDTF